MTGGFRSKRLGRERPSPPFFCRPVGKLAAAASGLSSPRARGGGRPGSARVCEQEPLADRALRSRGKMRFRLRSRGRPPSSPGQRAARAGCGPGHDLGPSAIPFARRLGAWRGSSSRPPRLGPSRAASSRAPACGRCARAGGVTPTPRLPALTELRCRAGRRAEARSPPRPPGAARRLRGPVRPRALLGARLRRR